MKFAFIATRLAVILIAADAACSCQSSKRPIGHHIVLRGRIACTTRWEQSEVFAVLRHAKWR